DHLGERPGRARRPEPRPAIGDPAGLRGALCGPSGRHRRRRRPALPVGWRVDRPGESADRPGPAGRGQPGDRAGRADRGGAADRPSRPRDDVSAPQAPAPRPTLAPTALAPAPSAQPERPTWVPFPARFSAPKPLTPLTYTVADGDTLTSIAARFGVSPESIAL